MDALHKSISMLAVFVIPVLLAISLHEAAHGFVARECGDPTAAKLGRVSLNPLRHVDLFGTLFLPLMAYLLIQVPFGYAKPLPVNLSKLRNPRWHAAAVAAAGPAANLLMGLGWALLGLAGALIGFESVVFQQIVQAGLLVNAAMFVFNMMPVPPLDGGEILLSLLPRRMVMRFESMRFPVTNARRILRDLRRYLPFRVAGRVVRLEWYDMVVFAVFLLLLKFHVLDNFLIRSIQAVTNLFALMVAPFYKLLS